MGNEHNKHARTPGAGARPAPCPNTAIVGFRFVCAIDVPVLPSGNRQQSTPMASRCGHTSGRHTPRICCGAIGAELWVRLGDGRTDV